ncbi:hypothetical protein [Alteromonas macleodii]|uniref:hypothetical protein n=1 Tax=Alteromonas macleodii TaxID=28108 RepID=UPI0031405DC0
MGGKNRTFEESKAIRDCAMGRAFEVIQARLDLQSELLYMYADKIKSLQPIGHGSLTPHFQVCSKDGCMGCLHVRWKRWFDPQKEQRKRNRMYGKKYGEKVVASSFGSKDISNVKQVLPRGDEFKELREIVAAFEKVRGQRAKMIEHLSNALKCSSYLDV